MLPDHQLNKFKNENSLAHNILANKIQHIYFYLFENLAKYIVSNNWYIDLTNNKNSIINSMDSCYVNTIMDMCMFHILGKTFIILILLL